MYIIILLVATLLQKYDKSGVQIKASGGKLSPTSSLYIGKSKFNKKVVIQVIDLVQILS